MTASETSVAFGAMQLLARGMTNQFLAQTLHTHGSGLPVAVVTFDDKQIRVTELEPWAQRSEHGEERFEAALRDLVTNPPTSCVAVARLAYGGEVRSQPQLLTLIKSCGRLADVVNAGLRELAIVEFFSREGGATAAIATVDRNAASPALGDWREVEGLLYSSLLDHLMDAIGPSDTSASRFSPFDKGSVGSRLFARVQRPWWGEGIYLPHGREPGGDEARPGLMLLPFYPEAPKGTLTMDDTLVRLERSPLAKIGRGRFKLGHTRFLPDADFPTDPVEHVQRWRTESGCLQPIRVEVGPNGVGISAQLDRWSLRSPEWIEDLSAFLLSTPFSFPEAWVAGCAVGGIDPETVEAIPRWGAEEFEFEAPVSIPGLLSVLRGQAWRFAIGNFWFQPRLEVVNCTPGPRYLTVRVDNYIYCGVHGIGPFPEVELPCPWGWELLAEDAPPDGPPGRLRRAVAACCAGWSEPAELVNQLRSIVTGGSFDEVAMAWIDAAGEACERQGNARARYELAQLLDRGGPWEQTFWERTRNFPPRLALRVLRELPAALPDDPRAATAAIALRALYDEVNVFDVPGLLDADEISAQPFDADETAAQPFRRLLGEYEDGEMGPDELREAMWVVLSGLVGELVDEVRANQA
jgi:hypothetical protein